MKKLMEMIKKLGVAKVVFAILGLAFGFAAMLTESDAEYNWVLALVACLSHCALLEGMRAVIVKRKDESGNDETEKKKRRGYDWRNVVTALVATGVAILICLVL